jgi:CD2 antigen cytoplasmic tail-binding protein 2
MDADKSSATVTATSDIDLITHLASSLMSLGDTDIYSKTYEELVRSVRSAGKEDPSWIPPSADAKYEYKWDIPGNTVGQVFGPFGEEEMQAWYKAAYFGVGGVKVKVRQTNGDWGDWDHVFS